MQINIKDSLGAGIAAYRLHQALLKNNIDSSLLVKDKSINDRTILRYDKFPQSKLFDYYAFRDRLPLKKYKGRQHVLFSTSKASPDMSDYLKKSEADIYHFHWINRGFFRVDLLNKLQKPVVISMHDMWTFTGGCHYTLECDGYTKKCGKCPALGSSREKDFSRKLFLKKMKIYSDIENLTIIGLSKWLADAASNSTLLRDTQVVNLPNCIDTEFYKPTDKEFARNILKISPDQKVLLFGAMDVMADERKGGKLLYEALKGLKNKSKISLLMFGGTLHEKNSHLDELGIDCINIGFINDDISKLILYSSADLVIVPSMIENLSNVIMEAMACGVPVAAFNTGGNSDMIEHKTNGYLAESFSSDDLREGIQGLLDDVTLRENYGQKARDKVVSNFNYDVVSDRYRELYTKILNI